MEEYNRPYTFCTLEQAKALWGAWEEYVKASKADYKYTNESVQQGMEDFEAEMDAVTCDRHCWLDTHEYLRLDEAHSSLSSLHDVIETDKTPDTERAVGKLSHTMTDILSNRGYISTYESPMWLTGQEEDLFIPLLSPDITTPHSECKADNELFIRCDHFTICSKNEPTIRALHSMATLHKPTDLPNLTDLVFENWEPQFVERNEHSGWGYEFRPMENADEIKAVQDFLQIVFDYAISLGATVVSWANGGPRVVYSPDGYHFWLGGYGTEYDPFRLARDK